MLETAVEDTKGTEVSLTDLVMLQMLGKLDQFLGRFSNGGGCEQIIAEGWEASSTPKLFKEIVQRSVESQFGEKHVALRELVQNALDAYAAAEHKEVKITFEANGAHSAISVEDAGKGMSQLELLRDLLIPYNSGKEFDPEKIGKHGIGWYSTLDLAHTVEVITQAKGSAPMAASVFQREGEWAARIRSPFKEEMLSTPTGTRVVLHLRPGQTTLDNILTMLYHYAGHVGPVHNVLLNGLKVNTANYSYALGGEAKVVNRGLEDLVRVFLSTRRLEGNAETAQKFAIRDANPQHIVYTQNGLFVRFDGNPFPAESVHSAFFQGLTDSGIDFWVGLPSNIGLTKGRNNWIAEDGPVLTAGMYRAFEDTVVEAVLTNETILDRCSGSIDNILSTIFKKHYSRFVEKLDRKRFNFSRRMASYALPFGRGIAVGSSGLARLVAKGVTFVPLAATVYLPHLPYYLRTAARGMLDAFRYNSPSMLELILGTAIVAGRLMQGTAEFMRTNYPAVLKTAGISAAVVAALGGVGYLAYKNMHILPYVGLGVLATALAAGGAAFVINPGFRPSLPSGYKAWAPAPLTWLGQIGMGFNAVAQGLEGVVYRLFAMRNLEQKREEKSQRETARIAKSYMSKFHTDSFSRRIASKRIVKGEFVYYATDTESTTGTGRSSAWTLSSSSWTRQPLYERRYRPDRVSIDELVQLFAKGMVRAKSAPSNWQAAGDFLPDLENPLSKTLYEQLSQIRKKVEADYNPKVLEDYLHDIQFSIADIILTISDVFRPSQWGKYHMWQQNIDRRYYNPSKVTYLTSGFHWVVNNGLGGLRSLVASLARKETYGFLSNKSKNVAVQPKPQSKPKKRNSWSAVRTLPGRGLSALEAVVKGTAKVTVKGAIIGAGAAGSILYLTSKPLIWSALWSADALNPVNYPKYFSTAEEIALHPPLVANAFQGLWRYASIHLGGAGADYFVVKDDKIKHLDNTGLERIVRLSKLGQEYLAFYNVVSHLEQLMSQASGLQPRKVYMRSDNSWPFATSEILSSSEAGQLVGVNLNSDAANSIISSLSLAKYDTASLLPFINALLHTKAHQVVGRFNHSDAYYQSYGTIHVDRHVKYDRELYEAKEELVQKFAEWLSGRGTSLDEELQQYVPEVPLTSALYSYTYKHKGFAALTKMTRTQLVGVGGNVQRGIMYHYDGFTGVFSASNGDRGKDSGLSSQ